jgi:voltage-gated potassium channel|tara:strand:+ start:187 stop:1023 length:837 start_codon:yes stop_codon:yes gene_type:complete
MSTRQNKLPKWKHRLHEIIYEADTPAGKYFDIILLVVILFSVVIVMLESIEPIDKKYHAFFNISEWIITIIFSVEYFARIICIRRPKKYIFSFFGIIDLLSTIPKYLSFFFIGTHVLAALRALRLLRVFRILKLVRFLGASRILTKALIASRAKIFVFLFFVIILCCILGSIMYLVEGTNDSGFTSIPKSIYWAIVTLTTVGYGDIAPTSSFGQLIASIIMILGYGIIAIPTGIVTSELTKNKIQTSTQACLNCNAINHNDAADFCYKCGHKLNDANG